jgi:small subunit ribosomal protein S8
MNTLIKVLCHIRNAQEAYKPYAKVAFSKLSWRLLQILLFNGYIEGFTLKGKDIFIFLKYFNNEKTIKKIQHISSPTKRVYISWKKLKNTKGGLGIRIVSTPQGVFSDKDAKSFKLGGELLCHVF